MRAGRWESPRKTWPVMVPVAGGGAEDWAGSKRETRMSRVRIRRTFTAIPQSAGAAWRLYAEKSVSFGINRNRILQDAIFCVALRCFEPALPEAPRAADVVRQRHRDEDQEGVEAGADRHLDQVRLILHVHEEQDDDDALEAGDCERDDGIEHSQFDRGGIDGNRRACQQRDEHRSEER